MSSGHCVLGMVLNSRWQSRILGAPNALLGVKHVFTRLLNVIYLFTPTSQLPAEFSGGYMMADRELIECVSFLCFEIFCFNFKYVNIMRPTHIMRCGVFFF